ncbi:MAG: hypothetical protein HYY02_04795 [Chloroflexi bacterium]|nr:hypothetical protein [Chloroflexota bacterium]
MQSNLLPVGATVLGRRLLPSPEVSLAVILLAAAAGVLGALVAGGGRPPVLPRLRLPEGTQAAVEQPAASMALSLADLFPLSPEFEVSAERTGPQDNDAAAAAWPDLLAAQQRYQRWGRITGYQSIFWRPHPAAEDAAPIEVQSSVSLYRSSQGADDAYHFGLGKLPGASGPEFSVPNLAPAARGITATNGPFAHSVVLFRKGNAFGAVLTTSLAAQASTEQAVALARTLADRIP